MDLKNSQSHNFSSSFCQIPNGTWKNFPSPHRKSTTSTTFKKFTNNNQSVVKKNDVHCGRRIPLVPASVGKIKFEQHKYSCEIFGGAKRRFEHSFEVNQSFPSRKRNKNQSQNDYNNAINKLIQPSIKQQTIGMDKIRVDGANGLRFSAKRKGYFTPGSPFSGSFVTSASEAINLRVPGINPNKAVFTIDSKSSRILIVNNNACELLGYTPKELCDMSFSDLLTNKKKSHVSALAEGQLNSQDGTMILLSGKVVEMNTKYLTNVAVSLWIRQIDVEGRCLAVAEPVERRIAELTIDRNGRILSGDYEALMLFQLESIEQFDGMDIQSLIPAILLPEFETNLISKSIRKQKATGKTMDGVTFPLCLMISIYQQKKDNPETVVNKTPTATTITAVAAAATAGTNASTSMDSSTSANENNYQKTNNSLVITIWVFQNVSGLLVIDEHGYIESCNHHFSMLMFGYSQSKILGRHITELIPSFGHDLEYYDNNTRSRNATTSSLDNDESETETDPVYYENDGFISSASEYHSQSATVGITGGGTASGTGIGTGVGTATTTTININNKNTCVIGPNNDLSKSFSEVLNLNEIKHPNSCNNNNFTKSLNLNISSMDNEMLMSNEENCDMMMMIAGDRNDQQHQQQQDYDDDEFYDNYNEMLTPVNEVLNTMSSVSNEFCQQINNSNHTAENVSDILKEELEQKHQSTSLLLLDNSSMNIATGGGGCGDGGAGASAAGTDSGLNNFSLSNENSRIYQNPVTSTPSVRRPVTTTASSVVSTSTSTTTAASNSISSSNFTTNTTATSATTTKHQQQQQQQPQPIYNDGKYKGEAIHYDENILDILYTISSQILPCGRNVFCVWVCRDPDLDYDGVDGDDDDDDDGHHQNLTLTFNSLENSLGQQQSQSLIKQTSASISIGGATSGATCAGANNSSSRPASVSLLSQDDQCSGEFVKHYATLKQIGKGAYGYVKMAYRHTDRLLVVTKFILKEKLTPQFMILTDDKKSIPMEIYLLSTVKHPNIVAVLDVFENEKFFQLVMEKHGSGMDLFEFIDRRPIMDEKLGCFLFRQIANAVEYLHSLHILHRDIKDENIIIDQNFQVKLIDFGSATFMEDGKLFSTFYGTTEYCSPEVLAGNKYAGPELEMWSLGVTLYVLLFFENPFLDMEDTLRSELTIPLGVSKPLEMLLYSMLDKNPITRCTMTELQLNPWIKQDINPATFNFAWIVPCESHEANPEKYFSSSMSPQDSLSLVDEDSIIGEVDHDDNDHANANDNDDDDEDDDDVAIIGNTSILINCGDSLIIDDDELDHQINVHQQQLQQENQHAKYSTSDTDDDCRSLLQCQENDELLSHKSDIHLNWNDPQLDQDPIVADLHLSSSSSTVSTKSTWRNEQINNKNISQQLPSTLDGQIIIQNISSARTVPGNFFQLHKNETSEEDEEDCGGGKVGEKKNVNKNNDNSNSAIKTDIFNQISYNLPIEISTILPPSLIPSSVDKSMNSYEITSIEYTNFNSVNNDDDFDDDGRNDEINQEYLNVVNCVNEQEIEIYEPAYNKKRTTKDNDDVDDDDDNVAL